MADRPARRVEFIETLGRGGFGAVYLADVYGNDNFVQRLAVKVLSEEMTALDDIAARQRDEARLLGRLNHPNIVKVFSLDEIDGRPTVFMEYVEGADCQDLIDHAKRSREKIPPRAATQVVVAASSALDAAWAAPNPHTGRPLRVVHRDIKPANLLVSRHGTVKVLDFGVARGDFDREGKTESVQFGTSRYMAPETWLRGEVSHKSDIFALGMTLAELLVAGKAARLPLGRAEYDAQVAALLDAVCPAEWGEWGAGMRALLEAMLGFEPDARPSAETVHDGALALSETAPGKSVSRWARTAVPPLIEARRRKFIDAPLLATVELTGEHTGNSLAMDASATAERALQASQTDGAAAGKRTRSTRAIVAGVGAALLACVVVLGASAAVFVWAPWAVEDANVEGASTDGAAVDLGTAEGAAEGATVVEQVATEGSAATDAATGAQVEGTAAGTPEEASAATAGRSPTRHSRPAEAPATAHTPETDGQPAAAGGTPDPPEALSGPSVTYPVRITSDVVGGTVWVDGTRVGSAPIRDLPLSPGPHVVRLERDGKVAERTISVSAFKRDFTIEPEGG